MNVWSDLACYLAESHPGKKILGGVWQAQIHLKESGVEWLQKAICIEMGWCLTPRGLRVLSLSVALVAKG